MVCGITGDVGRGRGERKAAGDDLRDWVQENRERGELLGPSLVFILFFTSDKNTETSQ